MWSLYRERIQLTVLIHSARLLLRNPRVSVPIVFTLGLVVGIVAGAFALADALLWRPVAPGLDPLVQVGLATSTGARAPISFPAFRQLAYEEGALPIVDTSAWSGGVIVAVERSGTLSRGLLLEVGGEFLDYWSEPPALGRLINSQDLDLERFEGQAVVTLGYSFWQRHLGGSPDILGTTVRIEGVPFTVVGVAGKGFRALSRTSEFDLIVPLTSHGEIFPGRDYRNTGNVLWVNLVARLRSGESVERLQAALDVVMPRVLATTAPAEYTGARRDAFLALEPTVEPAAMPADRYFQTQYGRPIRVLLVCSLIVLVLGAANVATVIIARLANKRGELLMRVALGATTTRIARELAAEGVLVSMAGALVGCGVGWILSLSVSRLILGTAEVPISLDVAISARTAIIAGATSVAAVCLVYAGAATVVFAGDGLKWRGPSLGRVAVRPVQLAVLASLQIALCTVVLVYMGLLVRSVWALGSVESGVNGEGINIAYIEPQPGVQRPDGSVYLRRLLEVVGGQTGREAAIATAVLGTGAQATRQVAVRNMSVPERTIEPVAFVAASPGMFQILQVRRVSGRDFEWHDSAGSRRVAIISRQLAIDLFGEVNAVGRMVWVGEAPMPFEAEVVGVVEDVPVDARTPRAPALYVPILQSPPGYGSGIMLSRGADDSLSGQVSSLGYDYVSTVTTWRQLRRQTTAQETATMIIAGVFGVSAVVLVALGVSALLSFFMVSRMREFGVRLAVGATPRGVALRALRGSALLALLGMCGGAALAVAGAGWIEPLLFEVEGNDPVVIGGATASVASVVIISAAVQTRRLFRGAISAVLRVT